jgi:formamidopyrimidine-DNA glycosylase
VPELPEVETTRRGVAPLVDGRYLLDWNLRNPNLRWPVQLPDELRGSRIARVRRRAKYLIFELEPSALGAAGSLIIHLGMSGNLRVLPQGSPYLPHDHVELALASEGEGAATRVLRLNDPRRFGSLHWQPGEAEAHWLLAGLGPEPLSEAFSGEYLKRAARGRRVAVKNFVMDGRVVVGVGNIYANEALFLAGLRPTARAGRVTRLGYDRLVAAIKQVLTEAIDMGGTTLRDFVNQDGNPGYFKQSLNVYGRLGLPCHRCATPLKGTRTGQRATVFCPNCQGAQSFSGRNR